MKTQKFRESQLDLRFHQFLTNMLRLGVSNTSKKDVITFKVFKLLHYQNTTLREVLMELWLRERTKEKILIFRNI